MTLSFPATDLILLLIIMGGAFMFSLYMKDTTGWLSVGMR